MQYALLGILGASAGVISGLLGIGGAIIVVPALVFLFGFSQHEAQGTSLAMLLPPVGLLAAWRYWQAGHVNLTVAIIMAGMFFIGAAIGAHFSVNIPQLILKRIFGGLLMIIGTSMIIGRQ